MNNSELFIERPYLLFLILPALALILVPYFILPSARRKAPHKIISTVLHCLAAVVLVFILAGTGLSTVTSEQGTVILIDLSDSASGAEDLMLSEGQRLHGLIGKDALVGVVAFGADQTVLLQPGENGKVEKREVVSNATDIGAALDYAASILPNDRSKRIVLLSDGIETDGDALDASRRLQSRGVRVDTVCFRKEDVFESELQLTSLEGVSHARLNERIRLTARIDSTVPGKATLWMTDNGAFASTINVDVEEGRNYFELFAIPRTEGDHVYAVKMNSAEDTSAENNEASCSVKVEGDAKILIVSQSFSDGNYLKNLLRNSGDVELVLPYSAPKTIVDLCKYDQLILVNIGASDLPVGYDRLLSTYVSTYGRSLLTVGGDSTYSLGDMTDTGYEDLLPVDLDYQKAQTDKDVALMLVLDCSRSMSSSGSPNLSLAKQSAMRCVEAMSEKDSVGVISFSGTANVEVGLTLTTNAAKQEIMRTIASIKTGSGTNYCPALTLAFEELKNSRAKIRHVIFLSDGQPSDSGYVPIAREMYAAGITVSTIGLGYSVYSLPEISTVSYGRHYTVYDAEDLPDIMLSEAQMAKTGAMRTGVFEVQIPRVTALTGGVEEKDLPQVYAYIGTMPKEEAEVCLTIGDGDPLFARWNYGKGVVASFMSDIGGDWTDEWVYIAVCDDMVRRMSSTILNSDGSSSIRLEITQNGLKAEMRMETAAEFPKGSAEALVTFGEESQFCSFVQTGKGVYTSEFLASDPGVYRLTVTINDENGEMIDFDEFVHSVSYSAEYDAFARGGDALLYDVALLTDGKSVVYCGEAEDGENAGWDQDLIHPEMGSVRYTTGFLVPLGILAAGLYLVDLMLRYVRWKDLKRFFERLKTKKAGQV